MQKGCLKHYLENYILLSRRFKSQDGLRSVGETLLRVLIILNREKFQLMTRRQITDFYTAK